MSTPERTATAPRAAASGVAADLRLLVALLRGRMPGPHIQRGDSSNSTDTCGWMGETRRSVAADCGLLTVAAATVLISVAQPHGTTRLLLVLAAACLLPGCALLTRLGADEPLEAVALAVALGFTLEAAGAILMVWSGWWHPLAWALVLLFSSVAVIALDLRRIIVTTRTSAPTVDGAVGA